jgi:hypothetical protein
MKVIAGIGAVVVAAAIVIGGWQFGWWLKTSDTTNRTAVSYQYSPVAKLQNLIPQIDQVEQQLVDVNASLYEKETLTLQESEMVHVACAISARITTPLPSNETAFVSSDCGENHDTPP